SSIGGTDADTEKVPDTTSTRGVQCCVERATMQGEIESIQMTVGIYQHGEERYSPIVKAGIVMQTRAGLEGGRPPARLTWYASGGRISAHRRDRFRSCCAPWSRPH